MVHYIIRLLKRFAVLIPGIVIAYFSVRDIYPIFDRQFSSELIAILLTYILAAYVLIPALLRVLRIFIRPKHLPHCCVTPDGFASDPINIGLVGTREALIDALQTAGWFVADRHSLGNIVREAFATFGGSPYPASPMSSLYLFGRRQDIGFELQVPNKRGHRHHVRFWASTYQLPETSSGAHSSLPPQKTLWIGAASRDVGFSFVRHNAQVTHMIAPDTNKERELIIAELQRTGTIKPLENIRLEKPYRLVNRAWRGYLQSDGVLKIYEL